MVIPHVPTKEVCYENSYFKIEQDTSLQAVLVTYKRKGTSDEFRQLHIRLLDIFGKSGRAKIMVDTREMGIVAPDDQKWLGQHVIPQLARLAPQSFLYVAAIVPQNIFTQLAVDTVERISMEAGTCLNHHFTSVSSARLWLQEQ